MRLRPARQGLGRATGRIDPEPGSCRACPAGLERCRPPECPAAITLLELLRLGAALACLLEPGCLLTLSGLLLETNQVLSASVGPRPPTSGKRR